MNRRNRRNPLIKTFKDYLVPIIWLVVIIILLISFFGWDKTETPTIVDENRTGIDVTLNWEASEAYVIYPGWNKEEINNTWTLYKWEKIAVRSWVASINLPEVWKVELNKTWEMKFDEDGWLSLYSSDLWVNLDTAQKINMRYGSIFAKENSVLSVTQNEAGSTVYMMNWVADITNLSGRSVVLWKGQKITISRTDAADEDIDLSTLRNDLDDYFKSSEWYIRNNGDFYLNTEENTGTGTTDEETSTGSVTSSTKTKVLNIEAPADESTSNFDKIAISGSYTDESIRTISVNGVQAELNEEEKTFEIKEFILEGKENDLVYKSYDWGNTLVDKSVQTVYYAAANTPARTFEVQNFSLDASKFTFIKPTSNPYTTTEDLVTIQWYVPPGIVSRITVNGFQLGSLTPYGSYWRYHANAEFWNLKEWLNVYKVIYFGREWEVLHTNAFTIVKEKAPEPVEEVAPTTETDDTWTGSIDA